MKICIICSGGGHLSQATTISATIQGHEKYFVTCPLPHLQAGIDKLPTYFIVDPHISLLLYLKNFLQSMSLIIRLKPNVIISTGSGIAIATCVLGKIIGAKIIFVESGSRVTTPSRTGKVLYRFADLFIIQWESLRPHYPDAIYGGLLI